MRALCRASTRAFSCCTAPKRTTVLRKAIMDRRAVAVPGAHDAFSAKIIENAGFEAIQVSGYGVVGSYLGLPDVGLIQMKDVLDITSAIAHAVKIPVMADIDTGAGNAVNARDLCGKLIEMGVAGLNLEDQVFPKRCGHMAGKEVISAEEMSGKLRAMSDLRNQMDKDFIINARTDCFATHGLKEAIRRANLYLEAGADLAFIDGIKTRKDIEAAVAGIKGPLSVNLMDAVSGMKTELIPIPELAKMRVGRVSIPVASIMVVHKALRSFFTALKQSPTGILAGQTKWVSSFEEYTDFVGLKNYKKLEDAYLPKTTIEKKYHGGEKIVHDSGKQDA
eukprot:TRINITY_DN7422_c0_g1_i1.p1 TRINITY_DN7422_c0_g1~~TRINITY_DN7422_c0_g1_i1.p1  ORF type:complete len:335 (-),score=111.24 TRINITY_DN7422_c0_g1_i1:114-1118(-)